MRPLAHLWSVIEELKKGNEAKEVSIEDILQLVEKTIFLWGQAYNNCVYYRRLNILNASLRSKSNAKWLLNTYSELLAGHGKDLFDIKFRKKVLDSNQA